MTEWAYNSILAPLVASRLCAAGVQGVVVERPDDGSGYEQLPGILNNLGPELIVSLHLNAFSTPGPSGTCALFWNGSQIGWELAETLSERVAAALGLRDRGAIPRLANDRGAPLLRRTRAPTVILESAFVTNPGDRERLLERRGQLADAVAESIVDVLGLLA